MMRWLWSRNGTTPTSDRQVFGQTGNVIDELRALTAEMRELTAELNERAKR